MTETPAETQPTPADLAPNATPADVSPAPDTEMSLAAKEAATFGRIDADGVVWVKEAAGERKVGQYPDQVPENPLELYVRRFLDLQAQLDLAQARLAHLGARDIDSTLEALKKALQDPPAVGDLDGLRVRLGQLLELGAARKEELKKEREAAKEQALLDRTKLVETAEKVAAQDPAHTQWKQSGQKLRDLLEEWKGLQRKGPRLDRPIEDALWKRFSSARTTFDKQRKQFFSQLDAKQAEAKRIKESLIAKAESLSSSTDWGATSAAFRDLMNEWKAAGRASRKDDDSLWARFRAAQQIFFDARQQANEVTDAEYADNLKVKEELLAKAEAILPVTDIDQAKAALRPILDAWDQAGRVSRNDMQRIEKRLRAVEQAIRDAEDAEWKRSNPETKARAEGLMGQLQASIAEIEAKLEKAKAAGETKKVAEYEENLAARKAWLEQAEAAAGE